MKNNSTNKAKEKYDYAVIATDVLIFTIKDENLQVPLIKMKKDYYEGYWALPGGLVEPEEGLEEAARRHLLTKSGVENPYLEQLYTFGDPERDPYGRVVSVAYFALIPEKELKLETTERYAGINLFPIDNLPKLAYDHREIIKTGRERLQAKLKYTNIVYSLLPEEFTLSSLRHTYEIILDRKLDKRNFRKKIFSLNLVEETGKKEQDVPHRPAKLYRFKKQEPEVVEVL